MHNYKAISHDASSFFSGKATSGAQIDGHEVDLSHLKPEELTKALQEFEVGYAQLQREALGGIRHVKRKNEGVRHKHGG